MNSTVMKILLCLFFSILTMFRFSAFDIATTDGKVYHNVKIETAGDEEVRIFHSEGEKIVKIENIKPFDLKTVDGKVYPDAQLNGIRKDQIVVEQNGSVRSLRSAQLAPEIREAFGLAVAKPLNNQNQDKLSNSAHGGGDSTIVKKINQNSPALEGGKAFLSRLKQLTPFLSSSGYGITSSNIHKGIVFIRGGGGAGSGFVCNFRGTPVIITNAHVYAAMPNPTIADSDRREYKAKSALVSKTRDLVFIEIDLPTGVIPLELEAKVTDLSLDSGLAAYGDSLGDGVVTDLKGILQGIGPGVIEISAGIVPGNSGGPVVGENFRVIGVSTYLQRQSLSKNIFDGTRFGNKNASDEGVRRFATRVDNIDLNDFEVIDPEKKQKDLDACKILMEANNSLLKNIMEYKNSFQAMMFLMKTYFPLDNIWNYRCSLRFLDTMFKSEMDKARFISVLAGVPMNNASALEREQAQEAFQSMQSYRKSQLNCPRCRGTGQIAVHDYAGRSRLTVAEKRTCDVCQGNPQRNFIVYNLHNAFLSGKVKTVSQEVSGLFPGCSDQTAEALLKTLGAPQKMEYSGIIAIWQYKGNNLFPEATSTLLFFIAGRLESVTITFENSPATWKHIQDQIVKKYGKFNWDINHPGWHNCGIRGNGFSIDMRYSDIKDGARRTVIICQHDMLSYLKYLVLNDVGKNITSAASGE